MKKRKREIPGHVTIENHRRAVFLPSEIDIAAYEKIAPEIIRLRLESSEPICLFIHSFGGIPIIAESILRLMRAPRQDGERCLVTTVCIGVAASAAADLLFEYVNKSILTDPKADPIITDSQLLKQIVDFETNSLQSRKSGGETISGFSVADVDLIHDDFFNLKELLSGSYQKTGSGTKPPKRPLLFGGQRSERTAPNSRNGRACSEKIS
jgi:hypothetical protein